MYKAIFFDLDDTLLQLSSENFVTTYFELILPVVGPHLDGEKAIEIIQYATSKMISAQSDGPVLEKVFEEHFDKLSPKTYRQVYDVFMNFYQNYFPHMQKKSRVQQYARQALLAAQQLTDKIALATIPIFPRIAIEERLRWAGIADFPFSLITSFENMHCSKPNPDYFFEIAEKLQVDPTTCLMIGNDHKDDLSAKAAGLSTYLVTDFEMNQDKQVYSPDFSGSLQELVGFLSARQND